MPTVTTPSSGESREQSNPALRGHTRLGVVLPLCVIVALAIICIVIAALTSARRANDIAVAYEKDLLVSAIATRGDWSLRKLNTVIASDQNQDQTAPLSLDVVLQRVGLGTKALVDHDFVLVVDSSGRLLHSFINRYPDSQEWLAAALPELAPVFGYLLGRNRTAPDKVKWLTEPRPSVDGAHVGEASFLQTLMGRVVIVACAVTATSGASESDGGISPIVLTMQFVDDALLADIGTRLQLAHLRKISDAQAPADDDDYVFKVLDARGQAVTQFAWTPQRPAAAVINSVIPFIALAIIGFTLLIAYILRYMRHTAAEIADADSRLRYLALHDPLCGLPNRICFSEELESTITKVRRGGPPAAVFYIDLDHFKDVNDTLGHSIGDELIRGVTQRLTHAIRGGDLVARLGGDEFAIITKAGPDQATLESIARRLIATLCAPYSIENNTIVIGASIGIAFISEHSNDSATDIMRYADMALYRAKSEGRNRACVYDTVMDADLLRRKQLEQELRHAIETDQLDVAYQPVVNASGEKIVGVEALARWQHPERGFICPTEFIPLAEHSGLIVSLGEWILRRACRDGKAWPGLSIAVNVSSVQFRQADFVETVERVLAETGFNASRLELELTESTLIGNVELAESAMLRLKKLGVRLALDDFGTGYSSLLYLRRFPFDKLKIDRSFVLSIEKAADAAAIVHAIVSLGRGLGMKVTAEGVENAEQHLFLRAAGVHFMQGFRFGKPCSASEITTYLAKPGAYRSIARSAVAAMAS